MDSGGTGDGSTDDSGDTDGVADGGGPGDFEAVTLVADEAFPTVLDLHVETGGPTGELWVRFGLDGAFDQQTPRWSTDGTLDTSVLGLKAGRTYELQVELETPDGELLRSGTYERTIAPRATGLPAFDVTVSEPGQQDGGYIVTSLLQADRNWVVVLDRDGDYVWWQDAGEGRVVTSVKLARNGTDVLYGVYDAAQLVDVGEVVRQPLDGGAQVRTRTLLGHHDFFEGADGDIRWMAYETRSVDVDGTPRDFSGDVIYRAPEGSSDEGAATLVWDAFDHLPAPAVTCSHMADVLDGTGGFDWSHGNSLVPVDDGDAFVYVPRHLDRIMLVDAASGEPRWILGEDGTLLPETEADGPEDDGLALVDHPHISHADSDFVAVFDNGDHRLPSARSALAVYEIDEGAGTYRRTFSWAPEESRFVPILGDLRRLPGGNFLSSWSNSGLLVELSPDGEIQWSAAAAVGSGTGRVIWVDDLYALSAD